jgi:hypothetical protein
MGNMLYSLSAERIVMKIVARILILIGIIGMLISAWQRHETNQKLLQLYEHQATERQKYDAAQAQIIRDYLLQGRP